MKHLSITVLVTAIASAMVGCGGVDSVSASRSTDARGFTGKLVLTGSSTMAPLVVEIGKRFEQLHPQVRVDVQSGGTSRGLADVQSGMAQLGMASRRLRPEELDSGFASQTLAVDGVGLIVHEDSLLNGLTSQQIIAIFTGKMSNWKELGGDDAQIVVVNKAEGRATLEVFRQHFNLRQGQIVADVIGGENQQVIQTVAGNPAAIGYVSIGEASAEQAGETPIKLISIDGIAPTAENVANGTFDLSRPLNLISNGEAHGLAKAFIEFAQSEEVHDLVEQQGFVPINR